MKSFIVGCIIIFVIAVALSSPLRPVASQSYTFATTTSIYTETSAYTSLLPIATYTYATSSYESISGLWYLGSDSQHCTNGGATFRANPGDTLTATISATSPSMLVYILTEQEYTAWEGQHLCDPRQSGIGIEWVSSSGLIQQASIDWTVPVSDEYWIVVEVFSGQPVTVTANGGIPTTVENAQVVYVTQYGTQVSVLSQTFQTIEQLPSSPQGLTPITIALVVVALVIVGYLVIRQRRGPQPQAQVETQAETGAQKPDIELVTTEKPAVRQFCIECGNSLPAGSKFCNKCGTKQDMG